MIIQFIFQAKNLTKTTFNLIFTPKVTTNRWNKPTTQCGARYGICTSARFFPIVIPKSIKIKPSFGSSVFFRNIFIFFFFLKNTLRNRKNENCSKETLLFPAKNSHLSRCLFTIVDRTENFHSTNYYKKHLEYDRNRLLLFRS